LHEEFLDKMQPMHKGCYACMSSMHTVTGREQRSMHIAHFRVSSNMVVSSASSFWLAFPSAK
jgi:peptide subunit release factor RF-3